MTQEQMRPAQAPLKKELAKRVVSPGKRQYKRRIRVSIGGKTVK